MQNNSKIQRPPKPNWRNEITIPTESQDLINENSYNFSLDSSVAESSDSKPPTGKLHFKELQCISVGYIFSS